METAILVDGSFFIKRYRHLNKEECCPEQIANDLFTICLSHLNDKKHDSKMQNNLYRIFFYDCPPISKKVHNPITGKAIDYSKSTEYIFRTRLHTELRKKRKLALRLGYLYDHNGWAIQPEKCKELFRKEINVDDLSPEKDIYYRVTQKSVDMKIGLDIAALAYKKLVSQIILIAGDSDFVPASKLARREGIDFILDPMGNNIKNDLHEHIDGLRSTYKKVFSSIKNNHKANNSHDKYEP